MRFSFLADRTTEVPALAPNHPCRRACSRYGAYAAHHVITSLLVSSAVAAILIYPFPFLYSSDFINGASNLPHHVWTLAQPLDKPDAEPDVVMRSIWVHGNYMRALDREILLGALHLQDELLGPTDYFDPRSPNAKVLLQDPKGVDLAPEVRDAFHVVNGLTNQSWFFQSPLQYWSCSADLINADHHIVATVNERKNQPTSVNVTLRHSIVFSGKRFEDRRLLAADALVITLIHCRDSPVGLQWERKAAALATQMTDKWTIYPADGRSVSSQLYEFQFRPMSVQDKVILGLAYVLAILYFLVSMSKLRAVKSKLGLFVTVWVQIVMSILSSFTICAIFNVDLSRIPQPAYPLVVLSMSLENIFRLINAVIATPSENSTSSRIGYAFGETAHVAFISSTQNVLILWGLAKVASPGVSAFCTFAAIGIIFDFFYLSTFFLSVLGVDVRRTELSDALEKASSPSSSRLDRHRSDSTPCPSWTEAMFQGKVAMSTRIAGTVIMINFVLVAQWHFFEDASVFRVIGSFFNIPENSSALQKWKESLPVEIHQARSPMSWLRMQDHDTAREVINVIKPWAHSYVAQVYEPIVFVLRGADRTPGNQERYLLPAVYDFLDHHLTRFFVTVLFILAGLRLLMNYLLWEEDAESQPAPYGSDDEPLMSVNSLTGGHDLDVVLLTATVKGHIVSVGLDRTIRLWNVRSGTKKYTLTEIASPHHDPFPILACAIDDNCHWLALLSPGRVQLWNLYSQQWAPSIPVDTNGQKPQAFFFGLPSSHPVPPLLVVRRSGLATRLTAQDRGSTDFVICKSPLVSAEPLVTIAEDSRSLELSILTASRKGCIHVATHHGHGDWTSEALGDTLEHHDASQVVPLPDLDCFLIARQSSVDLMDGKRNYLIHTFHTQPIRPRTLRYFHSARRKPQCSSVGLRWFGLAYDHAETGDCIIQTYTPTVEGDLICFRDPAIPPSQTCCDWSETDVAERKIVNPGTWMALPNGSVVGVRQNIPPSRPPSRDWFSGHPGLRRRIYEPHKSEWKPKWPDTWEVWVAMQSGRGEIYETAPLDADNDSGNHLMVSGLGPMVQAGTSSVVVGFGNILKLITVGHERFELGRTSARGEEVLNLGSRRRRPGNAASKSRANSRP
ncbi:hypothetical protein SODALDRAFT_32012 [Sodiomyces alkalinus F11]|uniref:Sterol regulatory element-binding protein cleavage-activating protein n=1 Tax=Sodiomyces alkalinus (strain CBS 110278 / VKM F-3762 / F11) TaxID=1314773 RepID=A0A3N2Q8T7_SODAK|nr:hypothetical protein SODALDRAFT_32012 [Sodiomyces alkalinus F11]ROT43150.1 hypothetical protein SODALDRAFT_32012 [Sodiomyces alkalinus F11]